MKHDGSKALDELAPLLAVVRMRGLTERQPGIFHRKRKAWLHFHEDKAGLFADIRLGAEWERFRVSDAGEQANLLRLIDRSL